MNRRRQGTIQVATGLTGINGRTTGLHSLAPIPAALSSLIDDVAASPGSYRNWVALPIWLEDIDTLRGWKLEPKPRITVSEAQTHGYWVIYNPIYPNPLYQRITGHVVVASATTKDGVFNAEESAAIVRYHIHSVVTSTQRDGLWKSRKLKDFGMSIQHADDCKAGRVLVAAGNVFVDIRGMSSSAALEPYALFFLKKAWCDAMVPNVPSIHRQSIEVGNITLNDANATVITIKGINTRFSVTLSVDWEIAAAGGSSDTSGVLYDRYLEGKPGSGKGGEARAMEFLFITQAVGDYEVHMYVADKETMVQAKSILKVKVEA